MTGEWAERKLTASAAVAVCQAHDRQVDERVEDRFAAMLRLARKDPEMGRAYKEIAFGFLHTDPTTEITFQIETAADFLVGA